GGIFRLGEADARHPRLGRILTASRRVWLRESPSRRRGKDLVAHALRLGEELGGPVAVVANRVGRALEVYRELGRAFPGRALLLTGRMRPRERDLNFARTRALQERLNRGEVAFVVATQALEVGADLDFAGMVTELADLSALKQRLGRVNRRGQRERAEVVVLGE
ncbi:type I-U CRISPR-associated helicase/endonuclease Cas3, partial [Thermus scotoductus]